MSDDEEFEQFGSGASETYPMQCSALRKNGFVCIKGKPCKIVDMSTSKTGKHGHAKVHIVALDIFENKKLEENCPSTHNVEVPRVNRQEYPILMITDDGYFSLLLDNGDTKDDIQFNPSHCSPNTLEEVKKVVDECEDKDDLQAVACVIRAMGTEVVKEVRKVSYK